MSTTIQSNPAAAVDTAKRGGCLISENGATWMLTTTNDNDPSPWLVDGKHWLSWDQARAVNPAPMVPARAPASIEMVDNAKPGDCFIGDCFGLTGFTWMRTADDGASLWLVDGEYWLTHEDARNANLTPMVPASCG